MQQAFLARLTNICSLHDRCRIVKYVKAFKTLVKLSIHVDIFVRCDAAGQRDVSLQDM